MMMRERHPIDIDAGTTFRFACRIGEQDGTDRDYFTVDDISSVTFRVRSSDSRLRKSYPMTYVDDAWRVMIPADVTDTYSAHRSMYYVIDTVFASGDTERELEGPIRVRPIGGVYR